LASEGIAGVGVVGCGLMGAGVAEVSGRADLDVVSPRGQRRDPGRRRQRIESSLARAVMSGKLSGEQHDSALAAISYTTDYEDMADRQLVVEAVNESEPVKHGRVRAPRPCRG